MKTVQLVDDFGINNLKIIDRSQPQPSKKQVLVKIEAVSLNYREKGKKLTSTSKLFSFFVLVQDVSYKLYKPFSNLNF